MSLVFREEMIRVCLVTAIIAPYRTPVFNRLATYPDIDLHVIYLAETEPNRQWKRQWNELRHDFLVLKGSPAVKRHGTFIHTNVLRCVARVRAVRPDVVIAGGWDQPPHVALFLLRRRLRYRFLWWVESTDKDLRTPGTAARRLKKRLATMADGIIVPGSASMRHVSHVGVSSDRIFLAPNSVEHGFFVERSRTDRSARGGMVRVLYIGQLTQVKGVLDLLAAWEGLGPANAHLIIAGEGPLYPAIRDRIKSGLPNPVSLTGHLDREEVAEELSTADIFVFPSRSDPWGLVVNEAAAAGLPLVATSAPGAVEDLLIHGRNGLIVSPGDVTGIAEALQLLINDSDLRLTMGAQSASISESFTPEACAAGLYEAIRYARYSTQSLARD